jgi:lysophospholipase L1-like esterase
VRRAAACLVVVLVALAASTAVSRSAPGSHGRTVLDLGDSLAVGTAPYLRATLPGYRIQRLHDVGLHAYDAAAIVAERRSLPRMLVVSAGTNDDPRIVSTFSNAVRQVLRAAGPQRCVVWPTIARPAALGATYSRLNRALARLAAQHENLVVVDWARLVHGHAEWLAPDGVHVGVEGYRARAAAIAAAIRTCPGRLA